MVLLGGLLLFWRVCGSSIPWSIEFRMMCMIGSASVSMIVLSSSVSVPSVWNWISFLSCCACSRISRWNRVSIVSIGISRIPNTLSRSRRVTFSTSSAIAVISGVSAFSAWSDSRAWIVTSSDTQSISSSSFSDATRMEDMVFSLVVDGWLQLVLVVCWFCVVVCWGCVCCVAVVACVCIWFSVVCGLFCICCVIWLMNCWFCSRFMGDISCICICAWSWMKMNVSVISSMVWFVERIVWNVV